jgi:hypothetical protein
MLGATPSHEGTHTDTAPRVTFSATRAAAPSSQTQKPRSAYLTSRLSCRGQVDVKQ